MMSDIFEDIDFSAFDKVEENQKMHEAQQNVTGGTLELLMQMLLKVLNNLDAILIKLDLKNCWSQSGSAAFFNLLLCDPRINFCDVTLAQSVQTLHAAKAYNSN